MRNRMGFGAIIRLARFSNFWCWQEYSARIRSAPLVK